MCSSFPGLLIGRTAVHSGKDPAFLAYDQFLSTGILQPLSRSEVRCGSFTSLPPYPRVRFTRRADIGPMPAFMSTRPTARPKICLLKSRRSTHAGRRAVRTARSWRGILSFTHLAREGRMTVTIGRRELLIVLGGGAVAWPLAARAQQPATPVFGFLHSVSPEPNVNRVAAFRKGLSEAGYVEGQNVTIEYRWAAGQDDRLADLAADLIRRRVAVIATPGSPSALLAAKAATTTIPIVFLIGRDPVALGLVASLNRPGGNATGVYLQLMELVAKGLGLLRELARGANRFVVLVNPNTAYTDVVVKDLEASALALGLPIEFLRASTGREIDAAFANLVQKPGCALFVVTDAVFVSRRAQIVTLVARHALLAI